MASCFYYFTNGEELLRLVAEEKFDELKVALSNSELYAASKVESDKHSALLVYKNILAALKEKNPQMSCDIIKIASVMFANVWLVGPLLEARESKSKFSVLSAEAQKVLGEYDEYKDEAIKARERNGKCLKWEEKYNDFVTVCGNKGRLSFFRHDIEHVIYYGEDKYYTEAIIEE